MVPRKSCSGPCVVVALMGLTLYLSFAFPYSLFLKQSETTQLKAVLLVARAGEETPSGEAFFPGEEQPAGGELDWEGQLSMVGRNRMFYLGKLLRLRYFERLLAGNPRRLLVRSADQDKFLESAQTLLAGLNPPRDRWIWSGELADWQPKAVHTTSQAEDDLLSSESQCLRSDLLQGAWKNSTRYSSLLNEFRHDLQTLRQNTGLEFEDDLEMLVNLEEALRIRQAAQSAPSWYTSTYAQQLGHVAHMAASCRFGQPDLQRLLVGRLLHEMIESIFDKIKADLGANGATILGDRHTAAAADDESLSAPTGAPSQQQQSQAKRRLEPTVSIYLTDKNHLSALLSSLRIFSAAPNFGAALLVELHYDPANQIHFLRLFTLNSASPNLLPEPVRVNPEACLDSAECSPQQFERNLRRLSLCRLAWQELCRQRSTAGLLVGPSTTALPTSGSSESNSSDWPADSSTAPMTTTVPGPGPEPSTAKLDELEESLIVGPTELRPPPHERPAQQQVTPAEATSRSSATEMAASSTTVQQSGPSSLSSEPSEAEATSTTTTTTSRDGQQVVDVSGSIFPSASKWPLDDVQTKKDVVSVDGDDILMTREIYFTDER